MIKIMAIVSLLVISACGGSDTPSKKIMKLMHAPMMEQKFQKTENPDLDYLVNMIPHHEGAVLSSEEFLKVGIDKKALTLASNIIAAQKTEIAEFEEIVATLKTSASSYEKDTTKKIADESEKLMKAMMMQMNAVKESANVDKDYLLSMVPHHQGAIEASRAILTISTNSKIIKIANRIIADQEREIKEIRTMVSNL